MAFPLTLGEGRAKGLNRGDAAIPRLLQLPVCPQSLAAGEGDEDALDSRTKGLFSWAKAVFSR